MPLDEKPLRQLSEADLLSLIGSEPERKDLEYKRDLPGGSEKDRKEFLYDASSFANTRGGHLVFGMEEVGGLPTKLKGLPGVDADEAILRMEQMLRSGIRPPIAVESTAVPLASGSSVIVMRISRSWNPPHQVVFQNAFRFYARDSNGKYHLDVDELRSVFAVSGSVADRLRDFRAERIARIAAGDAPVTLLDGGAVVIHVVPFSAFGVGQTFPLQQAVAKDFPTIGDQQPQHWQMTFDGLLTTSNSIAPPDPQRAYVQIQRNGAVEAVASSIVRSDRYLIQPELEARIVRSCSRYMKALAKLGAAAPIAVMVTLVGVGGLSLSSRRPTSGSFMEDFPSQVIDRDQLHFVESVFTSFPQSEDDTGKGMRITLDHLANAAGMAASQGFDSFGEYVNRDH